MKELPTAQTHRVVAEIGLPDEARVVAGVLDVMAKRHPDAVVVTEGPLWKEGTIVVAVPRENGR